ncbi:uncharacterized protein [Panulirus ornatus]|uniref:uncharacterized protein n=1 Tax=Panulirus ornatus TaxID=150431 RepID=UPI003A891ADF
MRALKEVILAAASLVATVSGRPGLILEHQAASNGHVIHGVAGTGEHRWGSSLDRENVIHRTTVENKHATRGPGTYDQLQTVPVSTYDPRFVVGRYDSGVVPVQGPVQVPVVSHGEEPVEVLIEAPVDEPVVLLIKPTVEKPVEILFEIPVEEPGELLTGTDSEETGEGSRDGPIEIYVEVSQGSPPEDCDEAHGVAVEAPVVEHVEPPSVVADEAAGGASVMGEDVALADEKDEDDIATPAEETATPADIRKSVNAKRSTGHLHRTSQAGDEDLTHPEEPDHETTPAEITEDEVTHTEAPDDVQNLTADPSHPNTRNDDLLDNLTEGVALHMTDSSDVEAAEGDVEAEEDLPTYAKTAALQVSNDDKRETDDAPSVNTPEGSPTTDRDGWPGDAAGTVPHAAEELLKEPPRHIGDTTSNENFPSVQSHDGETSVLRPSTPTHLPGHRTPLPSASSSSYKYYPGIPVHKQKRKRPRGFLIPTHR